MTKFATEELSYYFYTESDDKEGFFTVFFGNDESQFMMTYIAEFNNEDNANEYVEWKNLQLELEDGLSILEHDEDTLDEDNIDPEDDGIEDLVEQFAKEFKDVN